MEMGNNDSKSPGDSQKEPEGTEGMEEKESKPNSEQKGIKGEDAKGTTTAPTPTATGQKNDDIKIEAAGETAQSKQMTGVTQENSPGGTIDSSGNANVEAKTSLVAKNAAEVIASGAGEGNASTTTTIPKEGPTTLSGNKRKTISPSPVTTTTPLDMAQSALRTPTVTRPPITTTAPIPAPMPKIAPTPHTLADAPIVSQLVDNIFLLLETYGPLTLAQLEFNLPPGDQRITQRSLPDVLELLLAVGVIQQEADVAPPRFCVAEGIPRHSIATPKSVLRDLLRTQQEWSASQKRQQLLIEAMKQQHDPEKNKPPRETLKAILLEFPEIAYDPVYVAALRNLHIDLGMILDPPPTQSNSAKKKKKRKRPSQSGGGGSSSSKSSTPVTMAAKSQTASPSPAPKATGSVIAPSTAAAATPPATPAKTSVTTTSSSEPTTSTTSTPKTPTAPSTTVSKPTSTSTSTPPTPAPAATPAKQSEPVPNTVASPVSATATS